MQNDPGQFESTRVTGPERRALDVGHHVVLLLLANSHQEAHVLILSPASPPALERVPSDIVARLFLATLLSQ